jgi:uncharacterized membrane protein required for colicin V production
MIPNILDFIFLIFIVSCYFLSSLRGGVKQIFSFLSIIGSFFVAGMYYLNVAAVFPEKVFPESFAGAAGFSTVFLVVFGAISLFGRFFLDGIFKRLHFGGIDRFVSIFVGLLKGFTLSCITIVILLINYPADSPVLTDSLGVPYMIPAAKVIIKLLPEEEQKEFIAQEIELREIWESFAEEEE